MTFLVVTLLVLALASYDGDSIVDGTIAFHG